MHLADDKMDPVLEIWIEDGPTSVLVRLVGVADRPTSRSLLFIIDQLFDEGFRQLTIVVTGAQVALNGVRASTLSQGRASGQGRATLWEGFPFDLPVRG